LRRAFLPTSRRVRMVTVMVVQAMLVAVLGMICLCGVLRGAEATVEVRATQKISDTRGSFGGILGDDDLFGFAVAGLGDLET
jgi:hypothetical protein